MVFVDEHPHQLGDGQRRMRVIHLNGHLRREVIEGIVRLTIALHDVANGAGHQEVLLQQAQLAARLIGIRRIEDLGNRFGVDLVLHRGDVIAGIEDADVELV